MKNKSLIEYFKIGTAALAVMAIISTGYILSENDIKKDAKTLSKIDYGYYDNTYLAILDQTDDYYLNDNAIEYIKNEYIEEGLNLSDKIQSGIEVEENGKKLVEISNEIEFYMLKEVKNTISELTDIPAEEMEIHFNRDIEGAGEEYAYITYKENGLDKSIRLDHELISVVETIIHVQNTNQRIINGNYEYTNDNYLSLAQNIETAITNTISMRNHEYKAKQNNKYIKVKTL